MFFAVIGFALAALGWITLRGGARQSGDAARERRLNEALRALALASGLRVEPRSSDSDPCVLSGAEGDVAFRVEPGTRGMSFDGDVTVVAPCPSPPGRVVVWPRDPPDDVIDGLGEERPTRDRVFDARFAVFSSSATVMLLVSDPTIRSAIYDLGIVALVIQNDEVVLLLPGVPDSDSLAGATALLASIVTRCRRVEPVSSD